MKRAICSIQHSGTHALTAYIPGDWQAVRPSRLGEKDVVGHIVVFPYKARNVYPDLDLWMVDREPITPIRDMGELAYSWLVTHGHSFNEFIDALVRLQDFIRRFSPRLVDISKIPRVLASGDGGCDAALGRILSERFPELTGK